MELNKFSKQYLNIDRWVNDYGTIEIGYLDNKRGIAAMAIDEGGVIWEGEGFDSNDNALVALDLGIKKWIDENY